jgi:LAO/AO transport system kinase
LLPAHRREADLLLSSLLGSSSASLAPTSSSSGYPSPLPSLRIGVAGPPGAGKSSLIESLGLHLLCQPPLSARLAVVAVDPSSSRTGGSILGDKTRMGGLAVHPRAYVRPSPTRGYLGGVARATHEVIQLCECAGYSTVLVETVGLGQSETAVEAVVDCTLLVLPPSAGDELQGMKKGIVECADVVVVNKADGALEAIARSSAAEYRSALRLGHAKHGPAWAPRVLTASAATGQGVPELWLALRDFAAAMAPQLLQRRRAQGEEWMWGDFREAVLAAAEARPEVLAEVGRQRERLGRNQATPRAAAMELLRALQGSR